LLKVLQINEVVSTLHLLEEEFGTCVLIDFSGNEMTVKIQEDDGKSIGHVFAFLEALRAQIAIEEF